MSLGTANTWTWGRRSASAGLPVTTLKETFFPSFETVVTTQDVLLPHQVTTTIFSFAKSTCFLIASRLASSSKNLDFASSSADLISSDPGSRVTVIFTFFRSSSRTPGTNGPTPRPPRQSQRAPQLHTRSA